MKNITIIASIFAVLILAGCSTKREYFEPTDIAGKISYNETLSSSINYTTKSGATLKNGDVISKNSIIPGLNLDKKDNFIGEFNGKLIVANLDGNLKIIEGKDVIYTKKFQGTVVSASLKDGYLAALSSENTIYLIDINSDTTMLEYKTGDSFAQDSRTANPVFLTSLIIYPTLDGKIMIVDKQNARIIRDAVVSSDPFFNNVIFLDILNDKMFAATATKLIMISPNGTKYYNGQIKDVIAYQNKIYILLKDGNIEITDLDLQPINKKEFKFAIFSNVIPKGDYLYIFEKTGYLIKTDLNLNNSKIIELNNEIEDKSFAGKDAFYYDNKVLKLDQI